MKASRHGSCWLEAPSFLEDDVIGVMRDLSEICQQELSEYIGNGPESPYLLIKDRFCVLSDIDALISQNIRKIRIIFAK